MIIQGKNGLLVPNFDVKALAQAMSRMYSDKELYCQCKKNTKESVVHLTMENISKQWEKLINEVLDNSNRTK